MALAPFFDKTAAAAATLLRGFNREQFVAVLDRQVIGLTFDDKAVSTFEGKTALDLAINLLARLYPTLAILPLGEQGRRYAGVLMAAARGVNPNIKILRTGDSISACLVVGTTPVAELKVPRIFVGSNGWSLHVSSLGPVGVGDTSNPFGAAAAACLGAANIFRIVFSDSLATSDLDEDLTMSVLSLVTGADKANPLISKSTIGNVHLIGVGAIGNGAIWTLARVPELEGVLHLIDGETIDATNPQRYVLANPADEGAAKVALAARTLSRSGCKLDVRQHQCTWGAYLTRSATPWRIPNVAVAVDSARDRIAVQASLPRRVWNAWTQLGEVGVSHHEFLGERACLACLYISHGEGKNEDQLVAEAIGLPGRLQEVRAMLHSGASVDNQFLSAIADALAIPAEPLLGFAGLPLRVFYSDAICGGVVLKLKGVVGQGADVDVPMAFQSALAGVLLAAAVVADAVVVPWPKETKGVMDLLRPVPKQIRIPIAKHPSGRCICQDEDYQNAFRKRYEQG